MSMRIDVVNRVYNTYQAQAVAASNKIDKVGSKDEVEFSTEAKDFATIKNMLANSPEIRQDKVEEIKTRMDNGEYNVSSYEVASKILKYSFRG